jgi:DNA-binding MarR family transcriptional regulator
LHYYLKMPAKLLNMQWRHSHLGNALGLAMRRFDARVLALIAHNIHVPLALSNLAARHQVSAAHIHITRHLPAEGARLTELSALAGMTKQAMGDLVKQCEAWGLVERLPDPLDARAKRVCFTATGEVWLIAFEAAVAQAETEFQAEVGDAVATVVKLGLEAYAAHEQGSGKASKSPLFSTTLQKTSAGDKHAHPDR